MSVADVEVPDERPSAGFLAWRRAWLAMDDDPRLQQLAATHHGGLVVLAGVVAAMAASFQMSPMSLVLIAATLTAIVLVPGWRLGIVLASSLAFVLLRPFRVSGWSDLTDGFAADLAMPQVALQVTGVSFFLAFALVFLMWQRANAHLTAAKRPVLTLVVIWSALALVALLLPKGSAPHAFAWTFVGVAISCLWYLAYAAADQKVALAKGQNDPPTIARAGFMRPFWGGSATPIGKSFGYLSRFDAKDAAALGRTRLKALKLAVWATILSAVLGAANLVLYDELGLTSLHGAVLAHAAGNDLAMPVAWASLIANYFVDLLIIAVWGHFIVAAIRMSGWCVPRNTVNPLAARTLAEFWNRYFFYFKELLVDFFFYPAFLRWFKKNPKVRLAVATFCAAALGNGLYHFTRDTFHFATLPVGEALAIFQSMVFYMVVLGLGLVWSQWRGRKVKPEEGFMAYHVYPRLGVMAFFCFLKIFDDMTGEGTLTERMSFTLSLFGVT